MDQHAEKLRLAGIADEENTNMKPYRCFANCVILLLLQAESLHAHGTPILLSQNSTALVVSGGLIDAEGYVSQFFAEDDDDGDGEVSPGPVPNVGNAFLWEIPGFNISGLNTQSSLSIEVLAPTVRDNPPEQRTLWYWNADDGVVSAESNFYLLGTGLRHQTISPDDTASLPPFLMVNQVGGTAAQGGQQGFHNHGLLTFALDYNTAPAFGAYGFFARLTSNLYESSNPFLIVLNYGVDYELMTEAALAINAAAADSESLPGDYNHDGTVDAADYVAWRKPLPTDDGYSTWQTNFGRTLNGSGGGVALVNSQVPEPTLLVLMECAIAFLAVVRRNRSLGTSNAADRGLAS